MRCVNLQGTTYAMESGKEGVCTYLHRKKHTNNATLDKNKRYALTFEGISHPYLSP